MTRLAAVCLRRCHCTSSGLVWCCSGSCCTQGSSRSAMGNPCCLGNPGTRGARIATRLAFGFCMGWPLDCPRHLGEPRVPRPPQVFPDVTRRWAPGPASQEPLRVLRPLWRRRRHHSAGQPARRRPEPRRGAPAAPPGAHAHGPGALHAEQLRGPCRHRFPAAGPRRRPRRGADAWGRGGGASLGGGAALGWSGKREPKSGVKDLGLALASRAGRARAER